MLTQLTFAQKKMIDVVKEEYLSILDNPITKINEPMLKEAINYVYTQLKKPLPKIFISNDPLNALQRTKKMCPTLESLHPIGKSYDSGWCAFYEYFHRINIIKNDKFINYLKLLKCEAFCYIFTDKAVVAITQPLFIKRNNKKQLHCDTGPAVKWGGGFEMYRLNGIRVPKWLVMTDSGQINPEKALTEKNVDVQREIIRKIGAERMLKACNAQVLDIFRDNHTKGGNEYKLMQMKVGKIDRKYLYFEHASLPNVWYAQPVPPTTKTALHGRAYILNIGELNELERKSDKEIIECLPKVVS